MRTIAGELIDAKTSGKELIMHIQPENTNEPVTVTLPVKALAEIQGLTEKPKAKKGGD